MTTPAVAPQRPSKESEDRVRSMLKDICGPMLAELVGEQMATFRQEMEKQYKEGAIPQWLKDVAGKAQTPDIPDTAKQLIDAGGINIIRGGGDPLSRWATAIAAECSKGSRFTREGWYKDRYGEDDLYKALAATDAVDGGFLIPDAQSMDLIELLRPMSVFRQLNPNVEPMDAGKMNIPGIATGASASYIGENANAPMTGVTFRQLEMVAKKLACLVPISNDLIRRKAGTSNMVRDDMVAAIAQKSDTAFIRSDGTAGEPRGLRYRANSANLLTVNATVITENVMADLGNAMLGLMNNNVRMIRPAWLMAPRTWMGLMLMTDANGNFFMMNELSNKRLFGYPIGVTTNIPINLAVTGTNESEVYFVDMADVVIGDSTTLILDADAGAAYYDGSQIQASFSLDQTVLRAIVEHDITLRHDFSCAVLTDVDWYASGSPITT